MHVMDPNLSALGAALDAASQAARPSQDPLPPSTADDFHLSELVRSLRSLAASSPERQARIEQIARAYAEGDYRVDAQATASKIIDDALES